MIKLLIILFLLQTPAEERMWKDIRAGDVMAWGRHKTGWDEDDKFKSVATIHGMSAKANGDTRHDDEVWVVVDRGDSGTSIECFQAEEWGDDQDYCWFVDSGIGDADSHGRAYVPGTPYVPPVPDTYKFTYISENGAIWGIPVGDGVMLAGLDVGGVANNVGGGIVGLPYTGHPFEVGEAVRITNTTNYIGLFTLEAGTSENELQITDTYVAETFDGTEVIVKQIASLLSGGGHMVQDSSGNLYYGHTWSVANSTYVTKIETDGTLVYDFLNPDDWPIEDRTGGQMLGMAITSDSQFLYLYIERPLLSWGYMQKYNLGTGNKVWSQRVSNPGFDMAIDSDGNAYGARLTTKETAIWDVNDGSLTYLTDSSGSYVVVVDEDMDAIITAGFAVGGTANLYVCTLDDSSRDKMAVGGMDGANTWLIGTGMLTTDGEYIYVLSYTPTCTLYKISWDGTDLAVFDSGTGPDDGQGLYFDLWDNLVVVNQDWITGQSDVLYFYDSDLTYLSQIDNMYTTMLRTWDASTGGAWIQGNAVFDGTLTAAVPAVEEVVGVDVNWVEISHLPNMDVCVYADGRPIGVFTVTADANGTNVIDLGAEYDVVIAGINYYSTYESFPLKYAPQTNIHNVMIDFYESLGCNAGVSRTNSEDWLFSKDNFATKLDLVTEFKDAPFFWGTDRDPVVHLWTWIPVPNTFRQIITELEIEQ